MSNSQDEAKAKRSRVTENKRRYRARRKEYVADLERRLAEAQEHGVQATREVQLAARQVARENARLRQLLGLAGFSGEEIGAWVSGDGTVGGCEKKGEGKECVTRRRRRACEEKAAARATSKPRRGVDGSVEGGSAADEGEEGVSRPRDGLAPPSPPPLPPCDLASREGGEGDGGFPPPSGQDRPPAPQIPPTIAITVTIGNPAGKPDQQERGGNNASPPCRRSTQTPHQATTPRRPRPCKLLSRLADPSIDSHDIPGVTVAANDRHEPKGVECSRAYDMLVRFATSEEKMDAISESLESACVPDDKGGCTVRQDVVWRVLDGMCG